MLERVGHHSGCSFSGAAALAALDAFRFDLVLVDIIMPGMNGWELMSALRDKYPHLRGIAVSALNAKEHIARSREVGFAAHLTKPVNLDHLLAAIDDAMKPEDAGDPDDPDV
jgi:two-component system CheB/CheR fusion protein